MVKWEEREEDEKQQQQTRHIMSGGRDKDLSKRTKLRGRRRKRRKREGMLTSPRAISMGVFVKTLNRKCG